MHENTPTPYREYFLRSVKKYGLTDVEIMTITAFALGLTHKEAAREFPLTRGQIVGAAWRIRAKFSLPDLASEETSEQPSLDNSLHTSHNALVLAGLIRNVPPIPYLINHYGTERIKNISELPETHRKILHFAHLPYRMISQQLHYSPKTIRNYQCDITKRLGCLNMTQAMVLHFLFRIQSATGPNFIRSQ